MTSSSRDRTHPNLTLAVLALGGLAYALLSSAVVPALPTMQQDLGASETGITWLLTGYLLAASVGTSILGRLGDMYGKERLLLWTLVILAAGTLLAAVSNSLPLLIAARFIQGAGGGIFPLAYGIVRDEFPAEKVAGGIGMLSAILGIGGGLGIVLSGVILERLDYHWLFWIPLVAVVLAALATWRFVPESPVRTPGKVNWLAAALMTVGLSAVLLAISQTTSWGWVSDKTLGLAAFGVVVSLAWIAVEVRSREPLIDMTMMRVRGVWTTNAAAFLLGAGLYASFVVFPQFAQLPTSTGFGFGASVVVSGLYLLPATIGMTILGLNAGAISARFGSRNALLAGTLFATASFAMLALAHEHPYDLLIAAALLGIGIGLAFAALGNLIVQPSRPSRPASPAA
jgi:MFS family permease